MTTRRPAYTRVDDAALAVGLGLVVFGVAVLGFLETVFGSPHRTDLVVDVGVVIVHTSFTPHGRAYVVALGLVVLFAWSLSRLGRSVVGQGTDVG